jgi:hypothetical protein
VLAAYCMQGRLSRQRSSMKRIAVMLAVVFSLVIV